jgi:quercetin dioxygenase-like cupin family protein
MRFLAAVALVACSQPSPAPQKPPVATAPADARVIDAPPVSQEEKLAAIQKAMNELDEAAQGCWAAAATDRFDIEGELDAQIDIAAGSAQASIIHDTARNTKLASCVTKLLGAYPWAPPLHGETIQLPFKFKAPDGQSVIDRRLVEWHGQADVSVAVLLDENNTGNPAASMFELAVDTTTGKRRTDRAEVWYFLAPGTVNGDAVAAGDMMYIAAGGAREVTHTRAVVLAVPGGREGAARAGALPTPAGNSKIGPGVIPASRAKTYGPAMIFLDPSSGSNAPMSASVLKLPAGGKVPEHVHANETELLYILEGSGTMTIAGQDIAITPTSAIQVPPNTKHAFAATSDVRAVQFYTPPGPEQRFKKQ